MLATAALAPGLHAATVRLPSGFEPTHAAAGAAGSVWLAGGGFSTAPGILLLAPDGGLRSFPSPGGRDQRTGRDGGRRRLVQGPDERHRQRHDVGRRASLRHADRARPRPAFGAVAAGAPGHVWFDAGAGRIGELAADGSVLQVIEPPAGEAARRLVAADAADALWVAGPVEVTGTRLSRLRPTAPSRSRST